MSQPLSQLQGPGLQGSLEAVHGNGAASSIGGGGAPSKSQDPLAGMGSGSVGSLGQWTTPPGLEVGVKRAASEDHHAELARELMREREVSSSLQQRLLQVSGLPPGSGVAISASHMHSST